MSTETALTKALSLAVSVDPQEIRESVAELRASYPDLNRNDLASKVFSRAAWKATAAGGLLGLPANPWVAIPAAIADTAYVLRVEVKAAAKVALIYDPHFFDDDDAAWELLVPIFGINAASQAMRELGVRGGMGVSRVAIRKYLSKETLKQFKKVMLKYFGLKVTQRGLITKTLPVIGGIIGAVWNQAEVRLLKRRVIAYFEGQALV